MMKLRAQVLRLVLLMNAITGERVLGQCRLPNLDYTDPMRRATTVVPPPPCGRASRTVCLFDETRSWYFDDPEGHWIFWSQQADSIEVHTLMGWEQDADRSGSVAELRHLRLDSTVQLESWGENIPIVSAPFARGRMCEAGTYLIDVNAMHDGPFKYELRIRMPEHAGVPPFVAGPLIQLVADSARWVAVRPAALGRPRPLPDDRFYVVAPETYRLLVNDVDSLDVCLMPCREKRRFAVAKEGTTVIRLTR